MIHSKFVCDAKFRLVRRFRPMDEHERGGRGLNRWLGKPSASEIDDRKFRKNAFRKTPLSTGASNIITCGGHRHCDHRWVSDEWAAFKPRELRDAGVCLGCACIQ